jgi:CBS domain-containing protein
MATPALIAESTIRFLRAHMPFSRMARGDLEYIAERVRLAYFPVGTTVVDPAAGVAEHLHIIQRGHVAVRNIASGADEDVRGPGECFPVAALAAGVSGTRIFEATEDVFCFQLAREDFESLRQRSQAFAEYCTSVLESIVQQSLGQLRQNFSQRAVEQRTLLEPLTTLVRREPVHCATGAAVRDALLAMRHERVASIAVVDDDGRPVGIFTLTDLLDRVVLANLDLATPIAEVMSSGPGMLDEMATAQEALSLMAQRGYHQVMVTREGRLIGIVSERDLFALQRVTMRNVVQSVRLARDLPGLQRARQDIDALAENLIAQGAAAEPLMHTITALNDALTDRLFGLLVPRFELEGLDWCWLSVGSEGRREQTVATDQDNAMLFECAAGETDAVRARLLPFARAANDALAELGFPLCDGDIMARNPEYCLTGREWRERFAAWIREPTPEALLKANIFFDFRALYGNHALADDLRGWIIGVTPENRLFQRLLVANALQAEPPLGRIRTFRTDDGGHAGTIDLKTHGTRIFVDAARAFALALGIADTNTSQRLRLAGRRLGIPERETGSAVDACNFLQMLRLRAQRGVLVPERPDAAQRQRAEANRIDPYALNDLDQRMLKEAFRQARGLQQRLEQTIGQ